MSELDFFNFINERHRIYIAKESGSNKPWSDDPIFQQWKFCNVFRALDATSQYLIHKVLEPHLDEPPSTVLFNIFLFRAFNLPTTYELVGWRNNWKTASVTEELERLVKVGKTLTSGAYMLRGYENQPKWQSIPNSLSDIWDSKRSLYQDIAHENTLQNAYQSILDMHYWGWGPFTSYQIALDLSYTPLLKDPKDLNTWTYFGPGASRGLKVLYPNLKRPDYLQAARELLEVSNSYLEEYVPSLNLQDIEFCLCEYSKYIRIKLGGRGKHHYDGR